MTETTFRFAPDILRRLGEELNPSLDQSVLELVKNSYDANATECIVEIDFDKRFITVEDNGDGMTVEAMHDGWFLLGRSSKTTGNRTRLGRVPAGNKGLGRLAALRMGREVDLCTRPRDHAGIEYSVEIDWDEFDQAETVEDVDITIYEEDLPKKSWSQGTKITISDLSARVMRMDVKRLARSMILLADPFGEDETGFQPVLRASEFTDLEELVARRYFKDAEYHLSAEINSNGHAFAKVTDWKGETLWEASHEDVSPGSSQYDCPQTSFDFWAFLLTESAFSLRPTTLGEVREWLKHFGGVHLYHNGLRVAPYGNPGNDWLDINLQRVRSPEERPGTNNSIGKVEVLDPEGALLQKTDRSGIIESPEFSEIRRFGQDALNWMASERLTVAEARRRRERKVAKKKKSTAARSVNETIAKAPKAQRDELEQAFKKYEKSRDRQVSALEREVQLYRTLSTAGITAATFAHEAEGNPLKVIGQASQAIERRGKKEIPDRYDATLAKPVASIKRAASALAVLSNTTLEMIQHEKRRAGRVEVHRVVRRLAKTFSPFLEGRGIDLELDFANGSPFLRGTEAALESVVANLLNNCLTAFEMGNSRERRIVITTELESFDTMVLRVSDSGPGFQGISPKDAFLPGHTTRPNGTGLGLTIVRDAVADLGGSVSAASDGMLGGADVTVELRIMGA